MGTQELVVETSLTGTQKSLIDMSNGTRFSIQVLNHKYETAQQKYADILMSIKKKRP